MWNKLTEDLRSSTSLKDFRTKICQISSEIDAIVTYVDTTLCTVDIIPFYFYLFSFYFFFFFLGEIRYTANILFGPKAKLRLLNDCKYTKSYMRTAVLEMNLEASSPY